MFYDYASQDYLNLYIQNGLLIMSVVTFVSLFFTTAHYGKFFNEKRSTILISNNIFWFIEEVPNIIVVLYYVFAYKEQLNVIKLCMMSLFFIHYVNRAFIYPFKFDNAKKMPVDLLIMGVLFCYINALMQTRSIILFSEYEWESLNFSLVIIGLIIFSIGMYINIKSDNNLLSLKKMNKGYQVPRGFMFEYVSCPNYLGEMIEWIGFALCVQTYSGFVFAVFTFRLEDYI